MKTISLFLLVMLLLITFCSCDKKTDGGKYDGIFSPKEETPWNEEHEYDTYVVVVPTDASFRIYDAAKGLAKKLSENTGAYAEHFYAYEEIPKGDAVCRILLGDVGEESSQKYLRDFRSKDIGYKYHDKTVYIGGITEESLIEAIERFVSDVVVYADKEFFMNEDTELFVGGEYDIKEIKLSGFSLGEYTLVYPKDDYALRNIAEEFRRKILDDTGYLLALSSDLDLKVQSRVIVIGDCDVFEEYKEPLESGITKTVSFSGGVMILSEDSRAIKVALENLMRAILTPDEENKSFVDIEEETQELVIVSSEPSILSIKTTSFEPSINEMISIVSKVNESTSDVIRFDGLSKDSMQTLFYNFTNNYTLISVKEGVYHMVRNGKYTSYLTENNGVNVVKYEDSNSKVTFEVFELNGTLSSTLDIEFADATVIFGGADALRNLADCDGVRTASEFFGESGTVLDACFAGEMLSPISCNASAESKLTAANIKIKIIKFN